MIYTSLKDRGPALVFPQANLAVTGEGGTVSESPLTDQAPAELAKALEEKKPALVVLGWPVVSQIAGDGATAAALKVWVERGGTLFAGPAAQGGPPPAPTPSRSRADIVFY